MNGLTTSLHVFATEQKNVETIHSRIAYIEPNLLRINYATRGEIVKLQIPAPSLPHRADRLWEHTCFEAFICADGDSSYYEFNFSPSGEWAAYSFRGYRDGAPTDDEALVPGIIVRRTPDRLELDAVVRMDRLPGIRTGSTLRIGLSAVIEATDGTLSYWALKHPAAKPDFHHPDSFALELPFPSQGA